MEYEHDDTAYLNLKLALTLVDTIRVKSIEA